MPQFQYIARDKQGKTIKATLEAENKEAAADLVKKMHLKMISIRPAGRGGDSAGEGRSRRSDPR